MPAILAAPSYANQGACVKSIQAALKHLPASPLARRNLQIALRRLDGTILHPGRSIPLSGALGPWTAGDYVFAPAPSGSPYCATFGAGAEAAAGLALAAARAAGLTVSQGDVPQQPSPSPLQHDLRITNPTQITAQIQTGWEHGRPVLVVCACSDTSGQPQPSMPASENLATIAAVGDVLCDGAVVPAAALGARAFTDSPLAAILRQADVTIVNLEAPLTVAGTPTPLKRRQDIARKREFVFRAAPEPSMALLGSLGVDVASLANNHIFDYGCQGIADTHRALADGAVQGTGPGPDAKTLLTARLPLSHSTCRLISFATTETLPANAVGQLSDAWILDTRPGRLSQDRERVMWAVGQARQRREVPLVSFHWGQEKSVEPTDAQRELVRAAAEAGAKLIIGHHPHRLQPIDTIQGAVVAYSLGNFLFRPARPEQALTGVLVAEVLGPDVISAGLLPVRITQDGLPQLVPKDRREDIEAILSDLDLVS